MISCLIRNIHWELALFIHETVQIARMTGFDKLVAIKQPSKKWSETIQFTSKPFFSSAAIAKSKNCVFRQQPTIARTKPRGTSN